MKKLFVVSLLLSSFVQAEQFIAKDLTLTKVKLDTERSNGQCYVDILSVPDAVIKYYVSLDKKDRTREYGNYDCFVSLLHKKSVNIIGENVTYTAFGAEELTFLGSNQSFAVSYPKEIITAKISSKQ